MSEAISQIPRKPRKVVEYEESNVKNLGDSNQDPWEEKG